MEQFPRLNEFFDEHPDLAERFGYTKDSVIKLMKPLYGLKQSGNCWQEKVKLIMMKNGFSPLVSDNAIYINRNTRIIVASYVDDFVLIGEDKILSSL